jgi:hypothetical protein
MKTKMKNYMVIIVGLLLLVTISIVSAARLTSQPSVLEKNLDLVSADYLTKNNITSVSINDCTMIDNIQTKYLCSFEINKKIYPKYLKIMVLIAAYIYKH